MLLIGQEKRRDQNTILIPPLVISGSYYLLYSKTVFIKDLAYITCTYERGNNCSS